MASAIAVAVSPAVSAASATSPTTSRSATGGASPTAVVGVLTWNETLGVLAIVGVLLLAVGVGVIAMRRDEKDTDGTAGYIRSWIAAMLVAGLLLFCALAFGLADESLRSTLIGALTASVGTAVAFYFATKAGDQARQDVLKATGVHPQAGQATAEVPDLTGDDIAAATATLGRTTFKIELDPKSPAAGVVRVQKPLGGTTARIGTTVVVTLAPATVAPPPPPPA